MRDALGEIADHLVLVAHHLVEIQAEALDHHAMARQGLAGMGVFLRRLQQRLGGNAADIEASAPERRVLFHAGGFQAELRRADGGDIPARPRANDHNIEFDLAHFRLPLWFGVII